MPKSSPKQADRRWAYGELTVEDIVDAAAALVKRDGLESLSMRRLASELGLSSMAVYYYIQDKDELIDRVIDRVLASLVVPDGDGDWEGKLKVFYRASRKMMIQYPGLNLAAQSRHLTPSGRRMTKDVHSVLTEAGLDDAAADTAARVITHFLYGFVSWETAIASRQPRRAKKIDFDREFESGLAVVFRGIRASLAEA